ncbi:phosphodiester glycosidase family protein, partial [Christensenellaceae bacterium OttesenSCG-928-L17]|nr:phosphodiester glycosidase family protein [Christensenellaceae bacterium OttesenSCG-928-L17]
MGRREPADKIAQDNNAILAVNGDFLEGLVIRNGELHRKAGPRPTPTPILVYDVSGEVVIDIIDPPEEPYRPERATCVLYYDGRLVTEEYRRFSSTDAMDAGAWQGWQFGPTLVRNGEATDDVKARGRNPRCMLGYYAPGHYCIVMIDGRQKGYSIGMDFSEMTDLALRLGLTEAYNLDGGASAIMVFDGEIINEPSGSGDARNLVDMVVIGEYLAPDELFVPIPPPAPEETSH